MAEEIITIELDTGQLAKEANEATQALKDLKDEQKALAKQGSATEEEMADLTAAIVDQGIESKDANKILKDTVAQQKAAEGSIESQRRKLSQLTAAWKNQGTATKEGKAQQAALGKEVLALSDSLKEQESAVGNNTRNVGNYKDALGDAISASGGMTASVVTLGKAFVANPIGAIITVIVGAVTLLTKAFTSSGKGQEKMAKITATLSAAWSTLLKTLEPIAAFLVDTLVGAIRAPEEAIEDLWQSMIDYKDFVVGEFFRAMGALGDVFSNLLAGNFEEAGDALVEFADAATNVLPVTLLLKEGIEAAGDIAKTFGENMAEASKHVENLAQAEEKLQLAELERQKVQLASQRMAEQERQIRDDINRTFEEREAASLRLAKILDEQSAQELAIAAEGLRIAHSRIAVEGDVIENQIALAEAELKVLEIEERTTSQRSEGLTSLAALRKEEEDAALAAVDAAFAEAEAEELRINKEIALTQKLAGIKKKAEEDERKEAEQTALLQKQLEIQRLQAAQDSFGVIADGLEEGSEEYKIAKIAEATIATYTAANNAYASAAAIPFVGSALGVAAAAAAIAAGLANVQAIASAEDGGVFSGGAFGKMFKVGGKMHSSGGTKYVGEDGNRFEVERDEVIAVVNRSAGNILSSLSGLNESTGGIPFFQDGGIASRQAASPIQAREASATQMRQVIESLPKQVVLVEDIRSGVSDQVQVESESQF